MFRERQHRLNHVQVVHTLHIDLHQRLCEEVGLLLVVAFEADTVEGFKCGVQQRDGMRAGDTLASPLRSSGHFPLTVVEMISVAEESNSLDSVLPSIADSLEKRTFRRLDLFVRLLEPVMLLVMAMLVMLVVLALLVPVIRSSTAL